MAANIFIEMFQSNSVKEELGIEVIVELKGLKHEFSFLLDLLHLTVSRSSCEEVNWQKYFFSLLNFLKSSQVHEKGA